MLELMLEEAKDRLLRASPTTFAPFQGECVALMDVIDKITTNPWVPPEIEG